MQERYVSLDPVLAQDRFQQRLHREELFQRRLFEAKGGKATQLAQATFGLTFGLQAYVQL